MRNVQTKEVREERKVTSGFTMDPMEPFPSDPLFPPLNNDFFRTTSPAPFPRLMEMDNTFDFGNPNTSTINHDRQHHSTTTSFNGYGNGNGNGIGTQQQQQQQQTRSHSPSYNHGLNSSNGHPSSSLNSFQNQSQSHQSQVQGEPGKYVEIIPLGGNIGPEDLTVTLKDHVMTIEAKKETKVNSGSGTSTSYQEFTKKFTLPPGIDMRQVKSMLTPDGNLKIEAPLPQKAILAPPQRRERDVQIRIQ